MAKAEIYQDGIGQFRWRIRARNGRIIADSAESYKDQADCQRGFALLQEAEQPEIFQDARGDYRWRARARNGKIIADCAEGYRRRSSCLRGFAVAREAVLTASDM